MRRIEPLQKQFWIIAHRGSSNKAPENTMPAFELALRENADMIELDVLLTKDGVPVIVHDNHLKKFGYKDLIVTQSSYKELKELDVGSWFSDKYSGEKIPTLEQVLKWAKKKISLNIEIKQESVSEKLKGGVEEAVIALVQKYNMREQVLLSSFDYRAIKRCKQLAPDISIGILYDKKQSEGMSLSDLVQSYSANSFHCTIFQFYRLKIKQLIDQQIPVFIYTVNNSWLMKNLTDKGINGIFTDKPALLKKVTQKSA